MADISAQHKRVVGRLVVLTLVRHEFKERYRGDLYLLIGHLVELRDREFGRVLDSPEIGIVSRLVPFEEAGVVDEVLDQEIFRALHEVRGFRDFVQRGDRGAQDMKYRERDLT